MLVFLNQFFGENKTDDMNGFKGKDVYLCYLFNERNFSILEQCILRRQGGKTVHWMSDNDVTNPVTD